MFPDVSLQDHKVIVDEGGLYSSGGATSSLHLGMHFTEKFCGKETANLSRRMLLIDNDHPSQTRFSMFIPQTQHTDKPIRNAHLLIE
jgi:transcriptional regulator GlxA family with amidase domain